MSSYFTPAMCFLAALAGCIAPSANWPPAAPKGEASTQMAANKIRFRAFMSPLAVMRDAR